MDTTQPDRDRERVLGDRYELVEEIGRGGMAEVWRARDLALGRVVAIKFLRTDRALGDTVERRFLREARSLARLHHPGLVRVYEVSREGDAMAIVMEHVEGEPLSTRLAATGSAAPPDLRRIEQVARAIGHAHDRGIVHRDLKPSNILIDASGRPRVIDFGVAHLLEAEESLTVTRAVIGTPHYMSPEQADGRVIGPATDIHALGVLLYEMTTGRRPHDGPSTAAILESILGRSAPRPRRLRPDLDRPLERIVLRSMARDPADRYARADDLADDLSRYLAGEPIRRAPGRRRGPVLLAASAVLVAVLGGLVASRRSSDPTPGETPATAAPAGPAGRLAAEAGRAARLGRALEQVEIARRPIDRAIAGLYGTEISIEEIHRLADEGRSRVEAVLSEAPDLPLAHLLLGRSLDLKGDRAGAVAAWETALAIDPRFGPAHYALGRHFFDRVLQAQIGSRSADLGDAADLAARARFHCRAAIDLAAILEDDLEVRIAEAMVAYSNHDYDAIRRLTSDVRGDRPGTEYLVLLSAIASPTPAERLAAYDRAIALRPRFPAALFCRACERIETDPPRALVDLDQAIELDPSMVWAWSNRGGLNLGLGRLSEARRDLDETLRLDPERAAAYVTRSYLEYISGRFEQALGDADRALEIDPRREDGLQNRAMALEGLGRLDEARTAFDEILEMYPEMPQAWVNRARLRKRVGDLAGALADYDRAAEIDPRQPIIFYNRGILRLQAGDLAGAVDDLERCLRFAPPHLPFLPSARDALAAARRALAGR